MQNPGTNVAEQQRTPGFLRRALESTRYTITGIMPDTWMSPLQPTVPYAPEVAGRQWDYNTGYNIFYTPRGTEKYSFAQLRNLARNSELVRQAIETRQDQMDALSWKIMPKKDSEGADNDPGIKTISEWLDKPDGLHDWPGWLRVILEELYVTDAVSLLPRFNRVGGLYGLELIDGATIFPLIDENGRTPLPPNPAYQQILKGTVKVDYTAEELIYAVRKVQVNTPYGFSAVEQIAQSAKTDIERVKYQLAYFTEGSVPDAYMTAPEGMLVDQIKVFEEHFNSMLSGNYVGRRQVPIVPFGMELKQLKEPDLKTDFDEWMWRKIALAFRMSPTALTKQTNRATAESESERAADEGLAPIMVWTKRLIDRVIKQYFQNDKLEFVWVDDKEQDPKQAADIDTELVKAGILTINEVRQQRGLEDVEGGNMPMLATASGYVPIDGSRPLNAPELPEEAITQENGSNQDKKENKTQKFKKKKSAGYAKQSQ
jgi:hypothetical protein